MAKRDPERTKQQILNASIAEFSRHGLGGARVDAIAERAGANKRMIYHYFGTKDDLFVAALQRTSSEFQAHERELRLEGLDPEDGMRRVVTHTFDFLVGNPHFIRLFNDENLHRGRHLARSEFVRDMRSPLIDQLSGLLRRGREKGVFRSNVDPNQLYISISGAGYFYLSSAHTLSMIFERDLLAPDAIAARREHVVEVILGYLRP